MAKRLLTLLILIISINELKAQEHFITYNNDSEKSLISTSKSPEDYIKLALVANVSEHDANVTVDRLNDDIRQLNWESSASQKPEKRLKQLFQMVHAKFLSKYEETASFDRLFSSGEYQCVGASILYAYVLEKYQVPYEIKELPTHVYVVAYPGSYNILLETTDPAKGYFVPDAKTKENYVNALVKDKYLDEEYVKKVGIDQAFNEFFYSKTNLSLKQAVGVLYYNKAVEELDAEKYNEAYSNIAKAQILYPAKKNEFLQSAIMQQMTRNFKFNDMKDWEGLVYATNGANADEDERKHVEFEFDNLIQNKLWKSAQKNKVDEVYNYLSQNLKDTTLKSDLEDNYLMENARYAYTSNNFDAAQGYLEKLIKKNPANPLPKAMLIDIIGSKFTGQGSPENIKLLDQYVVKFPFIGDDPRIRSLYLFNYSFLIYTFFAQNNGQAGDKYLKMLVSELDSHKNHEGKYDIQVAEAFGKASEYYYRKNGKQKALDILNLGLKYVPGSEKLQMKVRVIKESKY